MKVRNESVIFVTDNHILILTFGSSNCLHLEKKQFFFLLYGNQMNQMKSHQHHSLENVPMFKDVSKAHESASVCGPFYWFSSNIYKRSAFIEMLVEKFSRDTIHHRIVEVGKASSWNNSS